MMKPRRTTNFTGNSFRCRRRKALAPPSGLKSALEQVREVFPGVQTEYACRLHSNLAAPAIEHLAASDYPKAEAIPESEKIPLITMERTKSYKRQCIDQLVVDFPMLNKAAAERVLEEYNGRYRDTFREICSVILDACVETSQIENENDHEKELRKQKALRAIASEKSSFSMDQIRDLAVSLQEDTVSLPSLCMWHLRLRQKRPPISDPTLLIERESAEAKFKEIYCCVNKK